MQEGLRLLQREGNVLKCHADHLEARWHAELGASAIMLDAGFNIASLQKKCALAPHTAPSPAFGPHRA